MSDNSAGSIYFNYALYFSKHRRPVLIWQNLFFFCLTHIWRWWSNQQSIMGLVRRWLETTKKMAAGNQAWFSVRRMIHELLQSRLLWWVPLFVMILKFATGVTWSMHFYKVGCCDDPSSIEIVIILKFAAGVTWFLFGL